MADPMPRSDARSGDPTSKSRREFIRRAAYVAPVLLTLPAVPAMAQQGSVLPPPPDCGPGLSPIYDENSGTWFCVS